MAFTYTDTLATDRDKVRFMTGDTVESEAMFSDEEIAAALTRNGGTGSWYRTAGALLQAAANTPSKLLLLHDTSGRTFVLSRLSSLIGGFADNWIGRG